LGRPHVQRTATRKLLTVFGVALLATLALAPSAIAGLITPGKGVSPNAQHIDSLYELTLWIALVIFVGVEGILVYALIRFRARKGAVAAQIHGNTRLEIGWTIGAAVILVVLAVITFVELDSIRRPPNSSAAGLPLADAGGPIQYASSEQLLPPAGKSLHILVNGQQYVWRFTYPGGTATGLNSPYSYEEMVVPTNTTVTLDVTAQDVVHSWWIPALGGKLQAVPGYHNYGWFEIAKAGVYSGQCAFICGRGHARMIADVRAVPPAQFEAWLAQRKADIAAANAAAAATRARLSQQQGPAAVNP
jgi:cytochrome c oxidase subunit 2